MIPWFACIYVRYTRTCKCLLHVSTQPRFWPVTFKCPWALTWHTTAYAVSDKRDWSALYTNYSMNQRCWGLYSSIDTSSCWHVTSQLFVHTWRILWTSCLHHFLFPTPPLRPPHSRALGSVLLLGVEGRAGWGQGAREGQAWEDQTEEEDSYDSLGEAPARREGGREGLREGGREGGREVRGWQNAGSNSNQQRTDASVEYEQTWM